MYRPALLSFPFSPTSWSTDDTQSAVTIGTSPSFGVVAYQEADPGNFPSFRAVQFKGNGGFRINNPIKCLPTWSIEFWFIEDSPANETCLLSDDNTNVIMKRSSGYQWTYSSNEGLSGSSVVTVIPSSNITYSNYVVITYDFFDNRTVRFYHNYTYTVVSSGLSKNKISPYLFFGTYSNSCFWKGWIGGITIYPFAMPKDAVALRYENRKAADYTFNSPLNVLNFSNPVLGENITWVGSSSSGKLRIMPKANGGTYKYLYKDYSYSGRLLWQMEMYNNCDTAKLNLHIELNGTIVASSHWYNSNVVKCNTRRQWVKMWAVVQCSGTTRFLIYPRPNADTFDSGYQLVRSMSCIPVANDYTGGWMEVDDRITCFNYGYLNESVRDLSIISSVDDFNAKYPGYVDSIKGGVMLQFDQYFHVGDFNILRPAFTINIWLRPGSSNKANYKGIFGPHANYKGVVGLQYENGVYVLGFGNGSSWVRVYSFSTSQIPDIKWSMVTWSVTYAGYHRVYLNGSLVNSGSYGKISALPDFWIGRAYNDSDRYYYGHIYRVTVYRAILSDSYVSKLYSGKEPMEVRGGDTIVTARIDALGTLSSYHLNYSTNYKDCMVLSTEGMPTVSPRNYSQLGRWVRYFRCYTNGNSSNSNNNLVQIQIVDVTGKEVSKGRVVSGDWGSSYRPTDGDIGYSIYVSPSGWSKIDLGDIHCIRSISVYRWYSDGRSYYNNYWEISEDNSNWIRVLDTDVMGTYAETATGHTIYLGAERGKWNIDAKTGTLVAPGIEVL